MILYHGSDHVVGDPDPHYNNPDNDFGQGFYLADDYQLAAEWACMSPNNKENIVNYYEFNWEGLKVLDFLDGTHTLMEWLGTMLIYRKIWRLPDNLKPAFNFLRDRYGYWNLHEDYDVVVSWRADDSYFNVSTTYLSNSCDIKGLKYVMSRGNMREQVVLVKPEAFENLSYCGYDDVSADFSYLNKNWRTRQDDAKRSVYSTPLGNPMESLSMLMSQYDIMENSTDIDEVAAAKAWIEDYHEKSTIQRRY